MELEAWIPVRLEDLIEIKHGFAFKGEFFRDEPPGDILLTPGNFAIGGGFKADKFKYYDGPVPEEFVLREGDLIVTMTDLSKDADTLGYPAFVPSSGEGHRYLHNQRLGKIVAKEKDAVHFRYLHYLMCSQEYRHEVVASATGTTVKHTSPERIKRFRFRFPPLSEQRVIAHILGTLDDKIELNRRMNETLEAMARAIFKSWFIDFDPVRCNAARSRNQPSPAAVRLPLPLGEGQGEGGIEALDALFPDRFEDSELGQIPEGWEVGSLADFSSLNSETWLKENRPAVISYVDLSNTKWGRIEAVTPYQREKAPSRAQRILRPGDTVVGTVRPGNGSYAFITEDGLTGSTGFAVLRPLKAKYAAFVYLAATTAENIEALAHLADGAAYPAVRPEVVIGTQAFRAGEEVLGTFARMADPLLARTAQNEHEARVLAALRDTLLPKLISGELRVAPLPIATSA